jgi:hypothetical protein
LSSIEARLTAPADLRQFRNFGLLVGGIWTFIGLWPAMARGGTPRIWAVALGIALVLPALIQPGILKPVHRIWMTVGAALGWMNTRIVLSVIFFALITPIGLAMRLFRSGPVHRHFNPDAETYRVCRKPRNPSHLTRQF